MGALNDLNIIFILTKFVEICQTYLSVFVRMSHPDTWVCKNEAQPT